MIEEKKERIASNLEKIKERSKIRKNMIAISNQTVRSIVQYKPPNCIY